MRDTGAVSVAERAFHRWEAHGIDCALACGGMGVCGYARLPAGTGLRRSADELGYAGVPVDVHGDLTFGPDEDGWIGFDTAHAWDLWTIEELSKVPAGAMGREKTITASAYMERVRFTSSHSWTLDEVIAETERLAAQLAVLLAAR